MDYFFWISNYVYRFTFLLPNSDFPFWFWILTTYFNLDEKIINTEENVIYMDTQVDLYLIL
jgi:hypothetical protein